MPHLEVVPVLHGVDVSAYQPDYDTDGSDFVFVKATEGRTYVNPRLKSQVKRARDAECVVGFYHFLWPGNTKEQAEYFLDKTPEKEGDLLAVDWEQTGEGTHASSADKDRFIREVKRLRPHHRVLLYCNRTFWLNHDTSSYMRRRTLDRRLRQGGRTADRGGLAHPPVHRRPARQERGRLRLAEGDARLGHGLRRDRS